MYRPEPAITREPVRSAVFQHLPEFIAAPADRHIALFGADLLCGFPYTGQILQHVKRSGSIVGDKCLGNCMVYRSYITRFSLPKLLASV